MGGAKDPRRVRCAAAAGKQNPSERERTKHPDRKIPNAAAISRTRLAPPPVPQTRRSGSLLLEADQSFDASIRSIPKDQSERAGNRQSRKYGFQPQTTSEEPPPPPPPNPTPHIYPASITSWQFGIPPVPQTTDNGGGGGDAAKQRREPPMNNRQVVVGGGGGGGGSGLSAEIRND